MSVLDRIIAFDERNSVKGPDALTLCAIIYLALPNLIFLGGWLRLPYAIACGALLLAALANFVRASRVEWKLPFSVPAVAFVGAAGFLWSSLGGAGHFFFTNPDWIVRDMVLADLTLTSWPPSYGEHQGVHHILRSAFGYFFPPALLGKIFGMGIVDVALYLWTALGTTLFLLLLPLPRDLRPLTVLLLVVVVFFSGMDVLGGFLLTGTTPLFPLRLEWWVPFSYSSLSGQLYWAPNHTLPLWLVTALFYRHWAHPALPRLLVIVLPLLVIWTPFAVLGILPFVGIAVLRWFKSGKGLQDLDLHWLEIGAGAVLTYLAARLLTSHIDAIPGAPTIEVAPNPGGFYKKYVLFVLMEFAILGLLLARELRHSHGLFWLSFIILAALPLYQFGPSNDTMLRLSTPCLVLILILILEHLSEWSTAKAGTAIPATAWAIAVVLAIGATTPFFESWRSVAFRRTPPNYGRNLVEHQKHEPPHYVGRLDRADLMMLLRDPGLVPTSQERKAQSLLPAEFIAR